MKGLSVEKQAYMYIAFLFQLISGEEKGQLMKNLSILVLLLENPSMKLTQTWSKRSFVEDLCFHFLCNNISLTQSLTIIKKLFWLMFLFSRGTGMFA